MEPGTQAQGNLFVIQIALALETARLTHAFEARVRKLEATWEATLQEAQDVAEEACDGIRRVEALLTRLRSLSGGPRGAEAT